MSRTGYLAMLLAAAFWLLGTYFLFGCAHRPWRVTAPHNFPPAHEWNAGLETSWLNAVDMWRRLTADREATRVSPPRAGEENVSWGNLEAENL
jgi:hypothetical protein